MFDMAKTKKKVNTNIWYIAIIIILVFIILLLSLRLYNQYETLKSHRQYFRQPSPRIESWMTIQSVKHFFNFTDDELGEALNISSTIKENKLTISEVCLQKHLNCTVVVDELSKLK
jgi:hypothetical protein